LNALGVVEHDQAVPLAQPARRCGKAREERQLEDLPDVGRRPNARVERLPEKGQSEAEEQGEREAQDAVADGLRLHLHAARRRLGEGGVRGLQRLHRP
jgi:hypothetical protein